MPGGSEEASHSRLGKARSEQELPWAHGLGLGELIIERGLTSQPMAPLLSGPSLQRQHSGPGACLVGPTQQALALP